MSKPKLFFDKMKSKVKGRENAGSIIIYSIPPTEDGFDGILPKSIVMMDELCLWTDSGIDSKPERKSFKEIS